MISSVFFRPYRSKKVEVMKPFLSLIILLTVESSLLAQDVKFVDSTAPVQNEIIRQELLEMRRIDQLATDEFLKTASEAANSINNDAPAPLLQFLKIGLHILKEKEIEWRHCERMKEIIDLHGWPGNSLVGKDGAAAAVRLVETSDHDRDFQKQCLQLMKEAPKGEVQRYHIAYLTDKLLVADGYTQVYGTQLGDDLAPKPIIAEDTLDIRRKAMGLPPLSVQNEMSQRICREFQDKTGLRLRQQTAKKRSPQ